VLDLPFQTGFTLSGQVLLNHLPLAGSQVGVFAKSGTFLGIAGADGGFRISNVPDGHFDLLVIGPDQELSARRSIDVTGDQEVTVEIAAGGLRGRISAAGTRMPIAGAVLRLEPAPSSDLPSPVLNRTSDGAGIFEVSRIATGTYRVTVEKEGFFPTARTVEILSGAVTPVEVELKPVS
jgi:hypothetical protein